MDIEWLKEVSQKNTDLVSTLVGAFLGILFLLVILLTSRKKKGGTE
jgi:hypothetical protein